MLLHGPPVAVNHLANMQCVEDERVGGRTAGSLIYHVDCCILFRRQCRGACYLVELCNQGLLSVRWLKRRAAGQSSVDRGRVWSLLCQAAIIVEGGTAASDPFRTGTEAAGGHGGRWARQ